MKFFDIGRILIVSKRPTNYARLTDLEMNIGVQNTDYILLPVQDAAFNYYRVYDTYTKGVVAIVKAEYVNQAETVDITYSIENGVCSVKLINNICEYFNWYSAPYSF